MLEERRNTMDKQEIDKMLLKLAEDLFQANCQVDMKTADIAVQEQYRQNAETIVYILRYYYNGLC